MMQGRCNTPRCANPQPHKANWSLAWRNATMSAPAFDYACADAMAAALKGHAVSADLNSRYELTILEHLPAPDGIVVFVVAWHHKEDGDGHYEWVPTRAIADDLLALTKGLRGDTHVIYGFRARANPGISLDDFKQQLEEGVCALTPEQEDRITFDDEPVDVRWRDGVGELIDHHHPYGPKCTTGGGGLWRCGVTDQL